MIKNYLKTKIEKKFILNNKDILSLKRFAKKGQLIDKKDSHASRIDYVIIRSLIIRKEDILANKILNNVIFEYY